jgi:hypothetical protein
MPPQQSERLLDLADELFRFRAHLKVLAAKVLAVKVLAANAACRIRGVRI